MNGYKVVCAVSILAIGSAGLAQDITDVEAKPFSTYTGGALDTVDLATGNLMLHIPLVSFPQLGVLPPLSFSVELNNAPYVQAAYACDSLGSNGSGTYPNPGTSNTDNLDCEVVSSRYDTSPPGAAYQAQQASIPGTLSQLSQEEPTGVSGCGTGGGGNGVPCYFVDVWGAEDPSYTLQDFGAYITSSFAGGIVIGNNFINTSQGTEGTYEYNAIDPSGTTHELISDSEGYDWYHAADGSGYTFLAAYDPFGTPSGTDYAYAALSPANGLGYFDQGTNPDWIATPPGFNGAGATSGVRLGTLISPTGVQYSDTIQSYPIPSNNTYNLSAANNQPYYTPHVLWSYARDASGNTISHGPWYWSGYFSNSPFGDIANVYQTAQVIPHYVDSYGRTFTDIVALQATQYGWTQTAGGYTVPWTVPGPGSSSLTYQINYVRAGNQISFTPQIGANAPDPSTDIQVSGWAISSITLPNGSQWSFTYAADNAYAQDGSLEFATGDLERVTTPTGETISYQYLTAPELTDPSSGIVKVHRCNGICHAVRSRTVTDGSSNGGSWTTTYSYGDYTQQNLPSSMSSLCGTATQYAFWTTETDSKGNDAVHSFCASGMVNNALPVASEYHEVLTQYYQGSAASGTLLKSVQVSYDTQQDIPTPYDAAGVVRSFTYPTQIVTTSASGASSTDVKQYPPLFTGVKIECNGSGPSGCQPVPGRTLPVLYITPAIEQTYAGAPTSETLLRTDLTPFEYQSGSPYGNYNVNMIALPAGVETLDSNNNPLAQTQYFYDETGKSPGTNGNLTSVWQWLSTTNTMLETHTWYDSIGRPTQKQDANGNVTTIQNSPCGATVTTPFSFATTYAYDCNTRATTGVTDPNGVQTTYVYSDGNGIDPLGRLKSVQYGIVANSAPQSTVALGYSGYNQITEVDIARDQTVEGDGLLQTKTVYDSLGRTIQKTNQDGYTIFTTYDDGDSDRVATVTTPVNGQSTDPKKSYFYDALGRVVEETQPDANPSNPPDTRWWCYDSVTVLAYSQPNCSDNPSGITAADWINARDENGNDHLQVYDTLNQLTTVYEPNKDTGLVQTNGLMTSYGYDGLGNLTSVTQLGTTGETQRARAFVYDSLSRLVAAQNPENTSASTSGLTCAGAPSGTTWSTCYGYDANGNVQSKTNALGVTTSYMYDGLNRLLSKTFSSNDPSGAPSSCYQYDTATAFGKGRLGQQWTEKGACASSPPTGVPMPSLTSISAYDAMGRVKNEQQCVFSYCSENYGSQQPTYSYDLAGELASYSDGRSDDGPAKMNFTSQYDNAGRLQTMIANPTTFTLFSAQSYSSAGLTKALYGAAAQGTAALSQTRSYDSHLRITGETDGN